MNIKSSILILLLPSNFCIYETSFYCYKRPIVYSRQQEVFTFCIWVKLKTFYGLFVLVEKNNGGNSRSKMCFNIRIPK